MAPALCVLLPGGLAVRIQSIAEVRRYNRQGRKANVGAGTATATEYC